MKLFQTLVTLASFFVTVFCGGCVPNIYDIPECSGDEVVDENGAECPGGGSPGAKGEQVNLEGEVTLETWLCISPCNETGCSNGDYVAWVLVESLETQQSILGYELWGWDGYYYSTTAGIHSYIEQGELFKIGVVIADSERYIELVVFEAEGVLGGVEVVASTLTTINEKTADAADCENFVSKRRLFDIGNWSDH